MKLTKAFISKVGGFDENGSPVSWVMGGCSVGTYYEEGKEIIVGGYTFEELREIKSSFDKLQTFERLAN